jgi:hypothetical protein
MPMDGHIKIAMFIGSGLTASCLGVLSSRMDINSSDIKLSIKY